MPHSFFRSDGLPGTVRIHHPPGSHHSRLSPANLGHRLRHSFSVLHHAGPRNHSCVAISHRLAPRISCLDAARSSYASRGYSRSASRDRSYGSAARPPHANHGPVLDLYFAGGGRSLFVFGEFRRVFDWPANSLARNQLRTDFHRADARSQSLILVRGSLKFSTVAKGEKNSRGRQFLPARPRTAVCNKLPKL